MKLKQCCALRFLLKHISENFAVAPRGARFTCAKCGQNFRKQGRWKAMTRSEAAQEILDMQAEEDARKVDYT